MKRINQDRLIQHFIELVKIDSESGNELAIAETLNTQLTALGFSVQKLSVPADISNGYNIYARLPGTLPGSILLSCHMDTVSPGNNIEPIIIDGVIYSKGNTVLGGDDKSGIAAIMEAIRTIQANKLAHQTIELAFTVYEEGGLNGSKNFDISCIESKEALIFDSGGEIGGMTTIAPGQQNLRVKITGKPAHAGLAPERGINALTVASDAISQMKLSRIDHETTANIGIVNGGNATNIVMPTLYLEAEARSLDEAKLNAQVQHMEETFKASALKFGADIQIQSSRSYNAYQIAEQDSLVAGIAAAFSANGITPQTKSTGGGSDANIFNEKGIKSVNLSTGMSQVHTTDEFISIADMDAITEFLVTYLSMTK